MIPKQKVRDLISKHANLEKELSSGNVSKDTFAEKSKEYSNLNDIIKVAIEYEKFDKNEDDLKNLINDDKADKELKDIAKQELDDLNQVHEINKKKLKLYLLPKDEADTKNAIIEIRAGTGGLEASLFASDLFKMYEKICTKKNGVLR